MTHEETRAMIIEIERRLQTIDPTMQIQNKIETDDIVSFLNQYQNMFIKDVYLSKSKVKDDKRLSSKLNDYLSTLIRYSKGLPISDIEFNNEYTTRDNFISYDLPQDYLTYITSLSSIVNNYVENTIGEVKNKYIDNFSDLFNIVGNTDNYGCITRKPIATTSLPSSSGRKLTLFHDIYTVITGITLFYIRIPQPITLDDDSACELPYECFDDLVQGTVDLYVSTKYKLSQPKAKNKQALTNFANLLDEAKKQEDEE